MAVPDSDFSARAEQFFAFERRHALFDYSVGGFSGWRVMRHYLFNAFQGYFDSVVQIPLSGRLVIAVRGLLQFALILFRGRKVDLIFKGCASSLRMQERGQWIDPDIDPLIDEGLTAIKLIEMNNADFVPNHANARYPTDLAPTIFGLLGRILGSLFPVDAKAFCQQTAKALSDDLGFDTSPKLMLMRISSIVWQARLFELLLKRCRPSTVVVTDTGEFALQLAAQRLGLPFVEIQHGIFDALHPDSIPEDVRGDLRHLLLPDALLMRGDFWIEQLKGFRQHEIAVAVGSHAVDQARAMRRERDVDNGAFHVVVTSQGLATSDVEDWIMAFAKSATSAQQMQISIKLHPVYDKVENYARAAALGDHVRISLGCELPNVYQLLANANAHISISSACHFDALSMGVPTAILPLQNHESLMYAVDQGHIHLLHHYNDIWRLSEHEVDPSLMAHFSKPGYVANVRSAIDAVLSGKMPLLVEK